jgi:two-component system, OmpR family, sensor histidine kinase VicK
VVQLELGGVKDNNSRLLTKVVEGPQASERLVQPIEECEWLYGCSSFGSLNLLGRLVGKSLTKILNKRNNGKHKGVRWIGKIDTKEDIEIVKDYLHIGLEIKHVNSIPVNFIVTDKEFNLTIDNILDGKHNLPSTALVSNDPSYIEHFNSLFERLWNDRASINASDRILEIEEGVEPEEIRILSDTREVHRLYVDLIKSALSEISIIIATPNALHRARKIGIIDLLFQAADERKIKVNMIIPNYEEGVADRDAGLNFGHEVSGIEELSQNHPNFEFRRNVPFVHQSSKIKSTFLLVDRSSSLIIDLKDDTQNDFMLATGFATFSSSLSRTQSYSFVFDTIWRQAELYEKLKQHDAMQKEFINIAAHELRTPVQAIAGYSELLDKFPEKSTEYKNAIARNADRLMKLSSNILDAARIESQTFKLEKTEFNLDDKIRNVIKDIEGATRKGDGDKFKNDVSLIFEKPQSIKVLADKVRIFEVISNLINNALKFTETGSIIISASVRGTEALVTVIDSGKGIDTELFPRLFTRFASRSNHGTGLGLFLSKKIVEAHGGKIWAHNNPNGKGATFAFTLPIQTNS